MDRPVDAAMYQGLHESHSGYQVNNWLIEEVESIKAFEAKTILEVGCGNGRFLDLAAHFFDHVFALDWAFSPILKEVLDRHKNITFEHCEVKAIPFLADLIVSADFLEHISQKDLRTVITILDNRAPMQFHKVACYDDGITHLSVMTPDKWLEIFRSIDPHYVLERIEFRQNHPSKVMAVFTRGRPEKHINWGCGAQHRSGYISVDIRDLPDVDVQLSATSPGPFQSNTIDNIYSRHMLEHLSYADALKALANWRDLLKPNGLVHVIVPDLIFHASQLLGDVTGMNEIRADNIKHAMAGFYGWNMNPEDTHKWGYTHTTLENALVDSGFVGVRRLTSDPWNLSMTASKEGPKWTLKP